jgi:RimJ/RimL family protein N-acetyltransferase
VSLLRNSHPDNFTWIEQRTGCVTDRNTTGLEAVDESGRIIGMVVYCNWTANAVQAHMAVDTPIAWRTLLPWVFVYPFEAAGKGLMLAVIPAHNAKSLRLTRRFGFTETHRIRDGWARGDDLVCFELRKEDCRYLGAHRKAA